MRNYLLLGPSPARVSVGAEAAHPQPCGPQAGKDEPASGPADKRQDHTLVPHRRRGGSRPGATGLQGYLAHKKAP
eukprot:CAMPEP_0180133754 /NCGR_PEP_ID=MMETSP0986-20121125/9724_1 /TAXON_ID=697907 /ORGANISM="non described non described, Strain CCMP2293" /LENGTH=74 /DNA_ID=CAMNT_0022073923 /DNA_START=402 /DNA_END=623 /DNA_ORIENTATION=-